jgi:hypothetical protein
VRGAHLAGQPRPFVNVDGDHQIEPQEGKVVQVVLRQLFAAQVRVDAAQPAKAPLGDARAREVGPLNAARVADDDILDVAFAIYQRSDLAARLVREFRQLPRELRRDDLLGSDAAREKLLDAAELIRFQPLRVSLYVANLTALLRRLSPSGLCSRAKTRAAPLSKRRGRVR